MRIVHTSDLHLDSPLSTRLSGATLIARKAELTANFRRLAEEARIQGARVIIIAGDLFDTKRISKRPLDSVLGVISEYSETDFLYLKGNHECDAFLSAVRDMPRNLKVFGDDWTCFDYGDVAISGRNTLCPELFSSLSLDTSKTNIVVLHGAVQDRSDKGSIGLKDAESRGIDYLALGHYHSYAAYDIKDGIAVYCGTLEGRGFDEDGDKGYVLIDTDGGISHSFVPFAKRIVRIIDVDISGTYRQSEVESRVEKALSSVNSDDLVRIVLRGKREPGFKPSTDGIVARWIDKYYCFEAKDLSGIRIDPADYALDKSLKGEFIRLVSSEKDLDEWEREAIISLGLSALMDDFG